MLRPCKLAHSLKSFDDEIASGVVALSSHVHYTAATWICSYRMVVRPTRAHPQTILVGPIGQESTEGLLVMSVDLGGLWLCICQGPDVPKYEISRVLLRNL